MGLVLEQLEKFTSNFTLVFYHQSNNRPSAAVVQAPFADPQTGLRFVYLWNLGTV